jgi:hypothetical protein
VEQYDKRKIYSYVLGAVNAKIVQLSQNKEVAVFLPKYSKKITTLEELEPFKKRACRTCGKDISQQHPKSKYCSAKYIG